MSEKKVCLFYIKLTLYVVFLLGITSPLDQVSEFVNFSFHFMVKSLRSFATCGTPSLPSFNVHDVGSPGDKIAASARPPNSALR